MVLVSRYLCHTTVTLLNSATEDKRMQKNVKYSKFDTIARNAAINVKKLVPALLGGFSKPLAKNATCEEGAEHKNSARQRLVGSYKHAARSWKEFKESRHQRKTILPQLPDQPSRPSNDFTEERCGDHGSRHHQQLSSGDDDADRRMQIALMQSLATDPNAQLPRRLTSPMPTYNSASDADDEYQSDSVTNVGPSLSTHTLPTPGGLGDHLLGIAPDRIVRGRLTTSVEQLVG